MSSRATSVALLCSAAHAAFLAPEAIGANPMTRICARGNVRKLSHFAGCIALGLAFAPLASSAPLISQGAYVETKQTVANACLAKTFCQISFTAIPAGKTLIVRDVSCSLTTGGSPPPVVLVVALAASSRFIHLLPIFLGTVSGRNYYAVNTSVFVPFTPGQIPSLSFQASPASQMAMLCTIAGELKP
jgi:hypothetical protein